MPSRDVMASSCLRAMSNRRDSFYSRVATLKQPSLRKRRVVFAMRDVVLHTGLALVLYRECWYELDVIGNHNKKRSTSCRVNNSQKLFKLPFTDPVLGAWPGKSYIHHVSL